LSNEDFAFDVCFEVRACCDVPEFKWSLPQPP
jgi:hypothetical protein